jgi:hypothetical protein
VDRRVAEASARLSDLNIKIDGIRDGQDAVFQVLKEIRDAAW